MADAPIARIRALLAPMVAAAKEATPGPWHRSSSGEIFGVDDAAVADTWRYEDTRFIETCDPQAVLEMKAALVATDEDLDLVERAFDPPRGEIIISDDRESPQRKRARKLLRDLGFEVNDG